MSHKPIHRAHAFEVLPFKTVTVCGSLVRAQFIEKEGRRLTCRKCLRIVERCPACNGTGRVAMEEKKEDNAHRGACDLDPVTLKWKRELREGEVGEICSNCFSKLKARAKSQGELEQLPPPYLNSEP